MFPIVEQEHPARPPGQQECQERHVGFGGIAAGTGEDEVIRPIVCGLAAARTDVVEGYLLSRPGFAAIGADGAVKAQ